MQINLKKLSEIKLKEYEKILENAKKEVIKIQIESKNKLDKDIKKRKKLQKKKLKKKL